MLARVVIGLIGAVVLVGCAEKPSLPPPSTATAEVPLKHEASDQLLKEPAQSVFTHTVANESEYYKNGPQQAQPPDGTFAAGTKVNVIEVAGSYSLVRSEDGVEAYVAADAVKKIEDGQTAPSETVPD